MKDHEREAATLNAYTWEERDRLVIGLGRQLGHCDHNPSGHRWWAPIPAGATDAEEQLIARIKVIVADGNEPARLGDPRVQHLIEYSRRLQAKHREAVLAAGGVKP